MRAASLLNGDAAGDARSADSAASERSADEEHQTQRPPRLGLWSRLGAALRRPKAAKQPRTTHIVITCQFASEDLTAV